MDIHNLSKALAFSTPVAATAAGTTVVNGTGVDMQGYSGVLFVLLLGALSANQVTALKAQVSDDNATNWQDLAGSLTGPAADADSGKAILLDIYKPKSRYVRPVVNRATGNAVVNNVIAFRYHSHIEPTDEGTSVIDRKVLNSPNVGTA